MQDPWYGHVLPLPPGHSSVGAGVAPAVGLFEGEGVGPAVGPFEGEGVGPAVGIFEGEGVGPAVGLFEGEGVGPAVGLFEAPGSWGKVTVKSVDSELVNSPPLASSSPSWSLRTT